MASYSDLSSLAVDETTITKKVTGEIQVNPDLYLISEKGTGTGTSADPSVLTVTFIKSYTNAPMVIPSCRTGSEYHSTLRVENLTNTGCILKTYNSTGSAVSTSVFDYIVISND